jgi:hypothetical protein
LQDRENFLGLLAHELKTPAGRRLLCTQDVVA